MGAVDETRKLMQDFLAPELREIKARIEALEQTTRTRIEALEQTTRTRIEALEQTTGARIETLEQTTRSRIEALEEKMEARFGEATARFDSIDSRFTALDARLKSIEETGAARHEAVIGALNHLANYSMLAERLARLEAQKELKAS